MRTLVSSINGGRRTIRSIGTQKSTGETLSRQRQGCTSGRFAEPHGSTSNQTDAMTQGTVSMNNKALARKLARAIFACGDEPQAHGGKTQRIQFMGGTWPDNERGMGGLSEPALVAMIERALAESEE
jgi:hypothetical protein